MNTKWLAGAMNGAITLCAVVVTGMVVRKDFFPPAQAEAAAPEQPTRPIENWRHFASGGHRWGPENAPVSIVVFSDFQCPACRKLAEDLRTIRAENPQRVAVIERHAPLRSHAFALPAARASECAARQGRFHEYHDALFDAQPEIGFSSWTRFAATARVPDVPAFEACVAGGEPMPGLARDTTDARDLSVRGTPTFLVNGLRVVGAPPLETLRGFVDDAARQAQAQAAGAP